MYYVQAVAQVLAANPQFSEQAITWIGVASIFFSQMLLWIKKYREDIRIENEKDRKSRIATDHEDLALEVRRLENRIEDRDEIIVHLRSLLDTVSKDLEIVSMVHRGCKNGKRDDEN